MAAHAPMQIAFRHTVIPGNMLTLFDCPHRHDFKFVAEAAIGFARVIDPSRDAVGVAPFARFELNHMVKQVVIPLFIVISENGAVKGADDLAFSNGGFGENAFTEFLGLSYEDLAIIHCLKFITRPAAAVTRIYWNI